MLFFSAEKKRDLNKMTGVCENFMRNNEEWQFVMFRLFVAASAAVAAAAFYFIN